MPLHPKPWLSVILPVHNGEKWVGAALHSLAEQLDREAEIVVIDTSDGPGTRAIVERYADRLNLRFVDPEVSRRIDDVLRRRTTSRGCARTICGFRTAQPPYAAGSRSIRKPPCTLLRA